MAFLVILSGPARGRRVDLAERLVMIGRDKTCTITIRDDHISRRHIQIGYDRRRDRHFAVDVGSTNGVTVNGTRLQRGALRLLDDGDLIEVGYSRLRYARNRG
ncbi:MAG: FHA domain-containing protein [Phycisphaerales bacterium]|nr:FHA domain-containing protein [Phycisphaerales bacterium]